MPASIFVVSPTTDVIFQVLLAFWTHFAFFSGCWFLARFHRSVEIWPHLSLIRRFYFHHGFGMFWLGIFGGMRSSNVDLECRHWFCDLDETITDAIFCFLPSISDILQTFLGPSPFIPMFFWLLSLVGQVALPYDVCCRKKTFYLCLRPTALLGKTQNSKQQHSWCSGLPPIATFCVFPELDCVNTWGLDSCLYWLRMAGFVLIFFQTCEVTGIWSFDGKGLFGTGSVLKLKQPFKV